MMMRRSRCKEKLCESLNGIADDLDEIERNAKKARIAGQIASVLGSGVLLAGGAATVAFTGGAALPAVAALGTALTTGGAATTVGADIVQNLVSARKIQEAQAELEEFRSVYLHIKNASKTAGNVKKAADLLHKVFKGTAAANAAAKVGKAAGSVAKAGGKALPVINGIFVALDVMDIIAFLFDSDDGLTAGDKLRVLAKEIADIDLE